MRFVPSRAQVNQRNGDLPSSTALDATGISSLRYWYYRAAAGRDILICRKSEASGRERTLPKVFEASDISLASQVLSLC